MNSAEIRDLMLREQTERDGIKTQIDDARRSAAAGEGYSDKNWLLSAEHAWRAKGRNIGRMQIELAVALKAERAADAATAPTTFEKEFVNVARLMVPSELFDRILAETSARVNK